MTEHKLPALCRHTASRLCDMLARGDTTSVKITEAYLQAIEWFNPALNAYLEVFAGDALQEAAASDARRAAGGVLSALDGIPVALKDNIVMRGRVCSCASKMLTDFRSPYDATVVERLHAAGMPILGRLNMDEFAMGSSTENSAYGAVRNPWDLSCVPGGSSGGSAAAVAAGLAPLALGSDTGGSVRQPAGFCGVVGVKPTYGTVSRYGLVAFASSLDQIGPLSKTVGDAALLMDVIAGHDPRDATSDGSLSAEYAHRPSLDDLNGVTLGMPVECFGEGLSADVREALDNAADGLSKLGARLIEVSVPSLPYALNAYYVISSAEASSNLARYDGVRYGYRTEEYAELDEMYRKTRREGFGAEVKRRILLGTFALSSGYQDQYYLKAQQARELLRHDTAEALGLCDALLSPVAPTTAFKLGEKIGSPLEMYLSDIYTVPANITGLPAISMPCGHTAQPLPVGMSLMGARDSLPRLMSIAECYERAYRVNEGLRPYDQTEEETPV